MVSDNVVMDLLREWCQFKSLKIPLLTDVKLEVCTWINFINNHCFACCSRWRQNFKQILSCASPQLSVHWSPNNVLTPAGKIIKMFNNHLYINSNINNTKSTYGPIQQPELLFFLVVTLIMQYNHMGLQPCLLGVPSFITHHQSDSWQ